MPNDNRFHGFKGEVYLAGVLVASVTKWTLNMKRDRVDVTAFGDAHKKYVQGHRDIQGTIEGFVNFDASSPAEGNAALFDAAEGDAPVLLKLVPTSEVATNFWTGTAVLDISVTVDSKGAGAFSGTFAAAGETDWTREGL